MTDFINAAQSNGSVFFQRALKKFDNVIPELDPIATMGIKDAALKKNIEHLKELEAKMLVHPLKKRADFGDIQQAYARKGALKEEAAQALAEIKKVRGGQFTEELKNREAVLRRMQYVDAYGNINAKGESVRAPEAWEN